jgi:vancomycin resistance protein YoaR
MRIFRILLALVLVAGLAAAVILPPRDHVLGSFSTSLSGRTRGQRENAQRAAHALDGVVIQPGGVFSFNHTVGSWTAGRGFVRAPVSYDGELIVDWGGGVCQTSSTLYNAALLAGLDIVERNRHAWVPGYVPPGRDAAVAQFDVDLRLRNPYPWPVRLRATTSNDSLGFEVLGRDDGPMASVQVEPQSAIHPAEVLRADDRLPSGQRRLLTHGRPGIRVAVYRSFVRGPHSGQRELLSRDAYPAMNRVVSIGSPSP